MTKFHISLLFSALFLTTFITGCKPTTVRDDPIRTEFVDACFNQKAYQSIEQSQRKTLCECTYDKTLSGLSKDEQQVARFYLLSQAGVDVRNRDDLTRDPNFTAMGKAAQAIGNAVRQCK